MKVLIFVGVLILGNLALIRAEDFLECYSCDSNVDSECATKPGKQLDVEQCTADKDECVTAIDFGITRRGCLSRLFPNKYCFPPCEKCNSSLCNGNIFPEDRLRCYQCTGADCIDVKGKEELLLPCPFYAERDRCYTNILSVFSVTRGCERTNLPETCPNTCLKCNYDGCNDKKGTEEDSCYECYHYPGAENPLCLRPKTVLRQGESCHVGEGLKKCSNRLMMGDKGKCFTYVNEFTGHVTRGCSTTMGYYPTGTVTECSGDDCNNECVDISCNVCTSDDTRVDCRSGTNLRPTKCEKGVLSCYSCESGTHVRRGCYDANFTSTDSEMCYHCQNKDGCNSMSIRSCYNCSSLLDTQCSTWKNIDNIHISNCTDPNELCVNTVVEKLGVAFTLRGCASQVPECTANDPFCTRCNGSLCNNVPTRWPYERLKALHNLVMDLHRSGQGSKYLSNYVVLCVTFMILMFNI